MRCLKLLIPFFIFCLLISAPIKGQFGSSDDDDHFITNPFLEDDIREKPKPKKPVKNWKDRRFGNYITNGAIADFEHLIFDFGSIPLNCKVAHNFIVNNTGTDSLIFHRIRPS